MRHAFFATLLVTLVAPAIAFAQNAPAPIVVTAPPLEDTLTLDDGTVITGHITEVRLFEHAIITRSDGVSFTVPWSRIRGMSADSVTLRAPRVQPPPGTPPAIFSADPNPPALPTMVVQVPVPTAMPSVPPDLRVPGPGRVPLRLRSTAGPVEVGIPGLRANGRALANEPVALLCTTPCTLYVPPGPFPLYVAPHNGPARSQEVYVLPGGTSLDVEPGSDGARAGSIALIAVGALSAFGGVLEAMSSAPSVGSSGGNQAIGTAVAVGGLVAVVGGIVLRSHGRTRIHAATPALISW